MPSPFTTTPTPVGPGGFRLRPARRGDSEALSALLRELGYPEGVDAQTLNWAVSHPEIEIHVAVDGQDRPVALLTLSHRPQLRLKGRIASVDELIVSASWRRKGVARALVRRAQERAKSLGAKRLELRGHGAEEEAAAAHFAEACGFSRIGCSSFACVP